MALSLTGTVLLTVQAKESPTKIKTAEPTEAAKDPDFAIQGEYVGSEMVDGKEAKAGVQVVALSGGNFDVRLLAGGLPGAGWDGKTQTRGTAKTAEGKITLAGNLKGSIADGVINIEDHGKFKKVTRLSPTEGAKPTEGAVVLFGKPEDKELWTNGKTVKLSDGEFLGVGINTKQTFGDFHAHVEFRLAYQPNDRGQGRSNSGFYLQNRYEVQVLDSFGLKGENNECGGIYTQYSPLVNMCFPPLTWQTYDIDFKAARFEDGKKVKPATATIVHNGVKIHDNIELKGSTGGGEAEADKPATLQLQNHGDPLVYRNIWVVEVK